MGVTLAVSVDKYKADEHCWLNVEADTIWAFVGPVVFVLAVRTRLSSSTRVCQSGVCFVTTTLINLLRQPREDARAKPLANTASRNTLLIHPKIIMNLLGL